MIAGNNSRQQLRTGVRKLRIIYALKEKKSNVDCEIYLERPAGKSCCSSKYVDNLFSILFFGSRLKLPVGMGQELYGLLDIHGLRTTAFRPQVDGESERINRALGKMLRCFVNEAGIDWDKYLDLVQLGHNTAQHSTHKYTPFQLIYMGEPKLPLDLIFPNEKLDLYLGIDSYATTVEENL